MESHSGCLAGPAIEEYRNDFQELQARIDSDPKIPVSSPLASFWQQSPTFPDLVNCKSEVLADTADIIIIGSGITGASAAYTILNECREMGIQKRVIMLEARETCSGATGRNGGHIKVPAYEVYSRNKKRYGSDRAKDIVSFQLRHLPIFQELEGEIKMEGVEVRKVETVDLFLDEAMLTASRDMVDELRHDCPELAKDIRIWNSEAAREEFNVGTFIKGAISYDSGAIWGYRFVLSLFSHLRSTFPGFSLEANTPVTDIAVDESDEKPFRVSTPRGVISTYHVLHATNSHAGHLVPGLRGKLFSLRGQMTAQRPGQNFPRSNGLRTWSFVQKKGFDYVVQRPGNPDKNGELMVGGGVFQSSRGIEEFGSTDDGTMDPVIAAYLGGILPAVFGSENWGADSPQGRLKEMWTGTMGYTADMQPIVGRLDYSLTGRVIRSRAPANEFLQPEPSEWISAGYNGEGMVHAWLCGVAVGLMILGRDKVNRKGAIGSPEGMMKDWLPEEFLCSAERITNADVSVLLGLM